MFMLRKYLCRHFPCFHGQSKQHLVFIASVCALLMIEVTHWRNSGNNHRTLIIREIIRNMSELNSDNKTDENNLPMDSSWRIKSTLCKRYPPKALLIGVPKSGTAALRMFLRSHPEIDNAFKSASSKHGVDYFTENYEKGLVWYIKQMPCSEPNRMIIDHTPQYFRAASIPERVYQFNSTIKLILIVREPISRSVSQILQMNATRPNMDKTVDIDSFLTDETGKNIDFTNGVVLKSNYYIQIKKWLDVFRFDQFYIVDGNELFRSPLRQLRELETFLGVTPYYNTENVFLGATRGCYCVKAYNKRKGLQCVSKGKGRVHPRLKDTTFNLLKKYFEPYNEQFFKSIGKRFNWTVAKWFSKHLIHRDIHELVITG